MSNPQKIPVIVKSIEAYTNQVYLVVFSCEKRFPGYKAGQFLHLALDPYDSTSGFWPESRVFSIAHVNETRDEVSIVFSVKGSFTGRMEAELHEGREAWIKAPYGDFVIENFVTDKDAIFLIAGGTGIAPFIPFIQKSRIGNPITLFYGVRKKENILFKKELKHFTYRANTSLKLYIEELNCKELSDELQVDPVEGRLSIDPVLKEMEEACRTCFFLSGPPEMITYFTNRLSDNGINKDRIIIDSWG